ncbi:MAG: FMN-binding protein [Bacteroidales bacterium]
MKKILYATTALTILLILSLILFGEKNNKTGYTDGVYYGKSKAIYTDEDFWGSVKVIIEQGRIISVNFKIIDSTNHETFNQNYEKHYIGNELYIQQCRADWEGVQTYPNLLVKSQNIDDVDVISGATWSYNLLKYSMQDALKNAKVE